MKKLLMGNEAIALGAIRAGVRFVCGYPGTPSTEVLETVAKYNVESKIHVEWSINEKAAMEVGAGASYAGARTLITMKQVGLNVASDPLMCLSYIGIKGGMVVLVADDPGPISSQTEQDTRHFAKYANLPVLDPSSPEEAYDMVQLAFSLSEKIGLPVILRPTTRICHACASIEVDEIIEEHIPDGFVKASKWVIFPRQSYLNHIALEQKQNELSDIFAKIKYNAVSGSGKLAVAASGVSFSNAREAIAELNAEVKLYKIGAPYPFPEKQALEILKSVEKILVIEELDPVIEDSLVQLCGLHNISCEILGKRSGSMVNAGEITYETAKAAIAEFCGIKYEVPDIQIETPLPVRPPVLCAGCPHRASFYAVKIAMKNKKAVFSGDIGCYTLGNAKPLDMVDTCLCMGAGITIAQGLHVIEPDAVNFAFIGDSTFFASGITGIINAVYNQTKIVIIILDNSTTAMTGHQPHPGTGVNMMRSAAEAVSIEKILEGCGVKLIQAVNPLELSASIEAVKIAAEHNGVSAIIFRSPCIAIVKPDTPFKIQESCTGCKKCIKELGCPAIRPLKKAVEIDSTLCTGCGLCSQLCPVGAIKREGV
jgi:indolepyruvate ferredoxin oxidoreductase alpha subunit